MAGNCSRESCYPEETGCNYEGCDVLSDCKYYKRENSGEDEAAVQTKDESEYFVRIPWTGNTFGLQDIAFLSSTSKVVVIGVAGVASAGKTTFLATLYCLIRHGYKIGDYQFAGSLTLNGWENIAWYLSWKQNNDIQFPPHTSSNAGRVPGLLHISLCNSGGDRKELIFTDAPGEWFDKWAFNINDENAKGARWIHEQSDAFLLFADCEMLAGEQLGKARKQIRLVSDRLKQNLGDRPLGLIWSKSDIEVDSAVKSSITNYILNSQVNNYMEFDTSVREGEKGIFYKNVCNSIAWTLSIISNEVNKIPIQKLYNQSDLFLSKR